MSKTFLLMPQFGQAMEFGTISEWFVDDGSEVASGQPVASIESDKAVYEIEAAASGIVRHLAAVGDEISVGEPFATIGEASEFSAIDPVEATPSVDPSPASLASSAAPADSFREGGTTRPLASPKARHQAESLQVDLNELKSHRRDGLIVADDVVAAAEAFTEQPPPLEKVLPISRLKRTSADRLARSWRQAPHFVQMIEVNATALRRAMDLKRQGVITCGLNDIAIKVAADTLAGMPSINAQFRDGQLVSLPDISVGLAVANDKGLTVPVVRGADTLSLDAIGQETRNLISAAREGRLGGHQVGSASVTISNLGAYGVSFGTPVLNLDEPILIFLGAIEDRPVAREGQVVLRPMTTLSIAYDHRVVDGLQAALYSSALKQGLETLEGLLPEEDPSELLDERELKAHSEGEGFAVSVRSRGHSWVVDEPVDIGGEDSGPDPVTYTLGGLLSCMIIALKFTAKRRKVPLKKVQGDLQATPVGKVRSVRLRLEAWSDASPEDVEKLLAPAKKMCLVHDLLKSDLDLSVELHAHSANR